MRVTYDTATDTQSVMLRDGVPLAESDEEKPGVILDYDQHGNLILLEVLDGSRAVAEPRGIEFQATP